MARASLVDEPYQGAIAAAVAPLPPRAGARRREPPSLLDRRRVGRLGGYPRSIARASVGLGWLTVAVYAWPDPTLRAAILLAGALGAWALDVIPDFAVGLALVTAWNLTGAGPTAASLSGFVSPSWFMLVGILVLAAALARSGLLERVALRLLLVFPATFAGQACALMLGGVIITPLLPLTVGRSALMASLAVRVAESLGYASQTRPAIGIGLAAFVGAGLMARGFLSGAALNLVGLDLLPAEARLDWGAWAVAAAPVTLLVGGGSLAIILAQFRPEVDRAVARDGVEAQVAALGPVSPAQWMAGFVSLAALAGFTAAPGLGIECAWVMAAGAVVLLAAGTVTREAFRSAIDWPLLIFLGVILSVPQMMHHAGVNTALAEGIPAVIGIAHHTSPVAAIVVVFLVTLAARFVLSEWVGVPLLTVALLPSAPALGLHPWIVLLVILVASNLWLFPYQFLSYATFLGVSENRLFSPRQVRGFCLAYMALGLVALLAAIPLWRFVRLLG